MTCFLKCYILKIAVTLHSKKMLWDACALYIIACAVMTSFSVVITLFKFFLYIICMCCLMTRALVLSASGMVFHEICAIL